MPKSILALFLLAIPHVCFAWSVYRYSDRLFLTGQSCDEVHSVTESLAQWTKSTGEKKTCLINAAPMQQQPSGICQVDITDCVPQQVNKYQSVNPKLNGPNCWNLALVMKGILPALRYSTPEEMAFYMQPPLCRALAPGEKRIPGDVGAIQGFEDGPTQQAHGFIYISDQVAYSKDGFDNNYPYSIQSLDDVYSLYQVPNRPECRGNTLTAGGCANATTYFRCSSMQDYLKTHPNVPSQILQSMKQMDGLEKCLQSKEVAGRSLSDGAKQNFIDITKTLASYLDQQLKQQSKMGMDDDERHFLLGALQLRLVAVAGQLQGAQQPSIDGNGPLIKSVQNAVDDLSAEAK